MFFLSFMIDYEVDRYLLLFLDLRKQKIKIGELVRNLIKQLLLHMVVVAVVVDTPFLYLIVFKY